jgi:hypothetical protein
MTITGAACNQPTLVSAGRRTSSRTWRCQSEAATSTRRTLTGQAASSACRAVRRTRGGSVRFVHATAFRCAGVRRATQPRTTPTPYPAAAEMPLTMPWNSQSRGMTDGVIARMAKTVATTMPGVSARSARQPRRSSSGTDGSNRGTGGFPPAPS